MCIRDRSIIKSVGIGSTTIYVDNVRPFFDPTNENPDQDIRATLQDKITIVNQDLKVGALASATISNGAVDSISLSNIGDGYGSVPNVSIQTPVGLGSTATATAVVTNDTVTSINVSYGGTGYTTAPQVLIDPPPLVSETNDVLSYNGDSGTVVGFGTTSGTGYQQFKYPDIKGTVSFIQSGISTIGVSTVIGVIDPKSIEITPIVKGSAGSVGQGSNETLDETLSYKSLNIRKSLTRFNKNDEYSDQDETWAEIFSSFQKRKEKSGILRLGNETIGVGANIINPISRDKNLIVSVETGLQKLQRSCKIFK